MQNELNKIAEQLGQQLVKALEPIHNRLQELEQANKALSNELASAKTNHLEVPEPINVDALKDDVIQAVSQNIQTAVDKALSNIQLPEPRHGKDALEIEILPSIDLEKEYPRGTYAIHNGGLFRAYQATQGIKGWECIVNGVKDIQVDVIDKTLEVKITTSEEKVATKSVTIPYPEYKGVFKKDEPYQKGDSTTWDGSLWIALKDDPEGDDPRRSSDWQLAVKRGDMGKGLLRIAKEHGFKGDEKALLAKVFKGEEQDLIVRLDNGKANNS